jgi:hypothetical protein
MKEVNIVVLEGGIVLTIAEQVTDISLCKATELYFKTKGIKIDKVECDEHRVYITKENENEEILRKLNTFKSTLYEEENYRENLEYLLNQVKESEYLIKSCIEGFSKYFTLVHQTVKNSIDKEIIDIYGGVMKYIYTMTDFNPIRFKKIMEGSANFFPSTREIDIIIWILTSKEGIRNFPKSKRLDYKEDTITESKSFK